MKLFSNFQVAVSIAATFFFVVATGAQAQCYPAPAYYPTPVYTVPIYTAPVYAAPRTVAADYQNIHYSGTVRSKEYVSACLPGNIRISIPVINGIAPQIDRSYSGNSVVYNLYYDRGEKWDGKSPISYSEGKKAPRVTETVETVHDYKNKKVGISEWTERPPSFSETRTKQTLPATSVPAPSFQDEIKKLQELYQQRQELYEQQQKLKDQEYAASQKLKDKEYQDTIESLRASVAELKSMLEKMEEKKTTPPVVSPPPKIETAPPPRIAPGMKKPSEIENPKGS